MAKKNNRKKDPVNIELRHPDRSGPTKETLLELAGQRSLFKQAELRQRELNRQRGKVVEVNSSDDDSGDETDDDSDDEGIPPRAERILDTLLWCVCLAVLHFTFDVLVQNQYAVAIRWPVAIKRALVAFPVFSLLFYNLHAHPSDSKLLPFLSPRANDSLRQAIFFTSSTLIGSYLIHITNRFGYMAVMKQAPPIGCLWVWSVIELNLIPAVASLSIVAGFMWLMGYSM